ncbi:MAG: YajQ family cyclic di-GMP-binding protein [Candidatus Solibacter sp.]
MPDNSFDVVSKIEIPEVHNAVQQAIKEVQQRFDLKDSKSTIEFNEKDSKIVLHSKDEFKLKNVIDILQNKLIKRNVPIKGLTYGELIPSSGSTVKQEITLTQGIPVEKARDMVKKLKDSKLKVQASISGDFVRVAGKDRDTLQSAIAILRGHDFGIDLQYTNFRTN